MHDDLERAYRLRFDNIADYRDRVWKLLTRDFFQAYVPVASVVLDLGCGWGEFVRNIQARSKYGMDLNPESQRRLPPDVTFLKQDCAERWPLPDATLDVVFSSNFFEHLPTKASLRATLSEARRCLKPGGRLVCLGPNVRYLPGSYWDFWDHHLPLSERSLGELLELLGFDVEVRLARFLPYSMSQGFRPPLVFLAVYLKLRFLWPVLGKQFLIVARKPA
jgi:SAM-dependent methyltransferase